MTFSQWMADIRFREKRFQRYNALMSAPHIRRTDAEMHKYVDYYEVAFINGRDYMRPWQKALGLFSLLFVELSVCLAIMAIMGISVLTWCAIAVVAIAIEFAATKDNGVADLIGKKIRDHRVCRMRNWLETAIWE